MECLQIKCTLCWERYSEERIPKNLQCGHSICTVCIEDSKEHKLCPECKTVQPMTWQEGPPTNYPLLRLIRFLPNDNLDVKLPTCVDSSTPSEVAEVVYKCQLHLDNPMVLLCCSCSTWVCRDCLVMEHPYFPRGSCWILGLPEALTKIRKDFQSVAVEVLHQAEDVRRICKFEMAMHDFCKKYCPTDNRSHHRLTRLVESQLQHLQKEVITIIDSEEALVRKKITLINDIFSPVEMTEFCKNLVDGRRNLQETISHKTKSFTEMVPNMLEHLKLDIKMLAEGRKPVYAVLSNGREGDKWAHLAVRDNRLILYSLRNGMPPTDGITLPFDHVRKLIPKVHKTIFFEVETNAEVLGRIYVRLNPETPLTQQMALLCSGEAGPSYRNTRFYRYDAVDGILYGGDYENNDGTGGYPLLRGLEHCTAGCRIFTVTGTLVADRTSSRFQFRVGHVKRLVRNVVGETVEGLPVLITATKLMKLAIQINVLDCGIFIPMTTSEKKKSMITTDCK